MTKKRALLLSTVSVLGILSGAAFGAPVVEAIHATVQPIPSPTVSPTPNPVLWQIPANADLMAQSAPDGPVVFKFKRSDEVVGDLRTITSAYTTPEGEPVITERAVLKGGHLLEASFVQRQINEDGKVWVEDGKTRFEYHKLGKTVTDSEKLRDNLVVPLTIPDFIFDHWDELLADKPIDLRIALVERQETVGIHLEKIRDNPTEITFLLSANSVFVALFAPTVEVTYDRATRRMLKTTSPVPARVLEKGKWVGLRSIMKTR